ncbi:MAG: 4'-phosphopantetheinyl transferase family protein [Gammaproteobacteria bacterium]
MPTRLKAELMRVDGRHAESQVTGAIEIGVWSWLLVADAGVQNELEKPLNAQEIHRADRFLSGGQRARFVIARGMMRRILGHLASCGPDEIAFEYGPAGKPFVSGGPRFNLSHSGDMAMLAVSANREVGVDIERIRNVERDLAARFFSSEEVRYLDALPADGWLGGFFRIWTRKEAVVKALGCGLSVDPRFFSSRPDSGETVVTGLGPSLGSDTSLRLLEPTHPEDYRAALAVNAGGLTIDLVEHRVPTD